MEWKYGRDVTSNNITLTEKDFKNIRVHVLFRDGKETWQGFNIKQRHINPEGLQ